MYNEFSIESVLTVLPLKKVIIKTNFTIDERTVNNSTVKLLRVSDATLEEYKISVSENTIELVLNNDLSDENTELMLIIRKIKDKLGRNLSASFNKKISFQPAYKKIFKITSPSEGTTLRSLDVDIKFKAASEEIEDSKYRVEVSSDMAFFNVTNSVLVDLNETRVTIPKDGQYYLRVRAESEDGELFGLWSDVLTFNVSTCLSNSNNCNDNTFLDDFVFTDNLFSDEIIPLEQTYISPNFTIDSPFIIEFNKELEFPEERDYDVDEVPPPECEIPEENPNYKPEENDQENNYIDNDTKELIMKIKAYQYINKRRLKTDAYLYASSDNPTVIEIYRPGKINFEANSIYEFIIPRLSFKDNTFEEIGKKRFITENLNLLVDTDDIKTLTHGLSLDDEMIMKHILDVSDIAKYWATKIETKIDMNKDNIKEEYYPFYMFIRYRTVYECLLEFYMIAATNPIKFKDAISDLSREEEYDLKYLKSLLDDYRKKADEWLEKIITITADPQWAVRGKYSHAYDYKFANHYHKYPVNGYKRGGFDK